MKRLFILIALMGFYVPAQADTSLGTWTCGGSRCNTPSKLMSQATFRMARRLNCAPNSGSGCTGGSYGNLEPGETYYIHVNARYGPGSLPGHAIVFGVAEDEIPTIDTYLQWQAIWFTGTACPIHGGIYPK